MTAANETPKYKDEGHVMILYKANAELEVYYQRRVCLWQRLSKSRQSDKIFDRSFGMMKVVQFYSNGVDINFFSPIKLFTQMLFLAK